MKEVEHDGAVLKLELVKAGMSEKVYDAFLVEGDWPTRNDLIILCDGGCPYYPEDAMCSGGEVCQGDHYQHRIVKVFV